MDFWSLFILFFISLSMIGIVMFYLFYQWKVGRNQKEGEKRQSKSKEK